MKKMIKYLSRLPNGIYFSVYSIGVKYDSPFHWDLTSTFIIQYSTFDIKIYFALKRSGFNRDLPSSNFCLLILQFIFV